MSAPDASGAPKYYRSHYNQWCCLHWMLRGATNLRQKTAAAFYLWRADTNLKWFSMVALSRPVYLDAIVSSTSCLIVPQTFSSFVFYPPSLSFCRSARLMSVLCTERSLLHIMSRHAPYCWLATSLFWYSAPTQFSKVFWKNDIPHL